MRRPMQTFLAQLIAASYTLMMQKESILQENRIIMNGYGEDGFHTGRTYYIPHTNSHTHT